jgi:hypothetical protein
LHSVLTAQQRIMQRAAIAGGASMVQVPTLIFWRNCKRGWCRHLMGLRQPGAETVEAMWQLHLSERCRCEGQALMRTERHGPL